MTNPQDNIEIPEFDAESFLESPALEGKLTEEEFETFTEDPDALEDAIRETPVVLTLEWTTDSPAGSGALFVHRWHGMYFLDSLDWGLEGPVASLDTILADERFTEPCPSPEISSDEIPLERLLKIAAQLIPEDERSVRVNEVEYVRDPNGGLATSSK
jgi:hypothetical protein